MNSVTIIGNLGKDPESRFTTSGKQVAAFSVATSYKYTDSAGEKREETEWHDVEVWGKQAENVTEYLTKGKKVAVVGRLKTDKWQDKQTGQERRRTKIVALTIEFLTPNSTARRAAADDAPAEAPAAPGFDANGTAPGFEDIPF